MGNDDQIPSNEEEEESFQLERPLECSECRRPIVVHYTEIVGEKYTHTGMCGQCPQLALHLRGVQPVGVDEKKTKPTAGLACGVCGTALEAVHMGSRLGCCTCYEVFGDVIASQLQAAEQLPSRIRNKKRTGHLHIGRIPGETVEMNSSIKLLALNEALSETLKREDYEQAALLRDQIKELTEKEGKKKKKKHGKEKKD